MIDPELPTPETGDMASTRRTAYVPQSQRHTDRLDLRVSRELNQALRADAERHGLTHAETVQAYRTALEASGRLEAALREAAKAKAAEAESKTR